MFYTEKLMESRMIDCRQCQRLRRDRLYVRTPICHLSTIPMSLYAQLSRTPCVFIEHVSLHSSCKYVSIY